MSYGQAPHGLLAYGLEPESGIPRVSLTIAKTYGNFVVAATLGHGVALATASTYGVFVCSATLGHGVSISTSTTWGNFVAFANIGDGNSLSCSATIGPFTSSATMAYGARLSVAATYGNFTASAALTSIFPDLGTIPPKPLQWAFTSAQTEPYWQANFWPIAQFASPMWENTGGRLIDLVSNTQSDSADNSIALDWVAETYGVAWADNGSTETVLWGTTGAPNFLNNGTYDFNHDLTLHFVGRIADFGASYDFEFAGLANDVGNTLSLAFANDAVSGYNGSNLAIKGSSGGTFPNQHYDTGFVWAADELHEIIVTVNKVTLLCSIYADGFFVNTVQLLELDLTTPAEPFVDYNALYPTSGNVTFGTLSVLNGIASPGLIAALAADPFGPFREVVPSESTTGGGAWRPRRHTAEERRAIKAADDAWEATKAERRRSDREQDVQVTRALDEIMDRHLGIVRPKEAPPPIAAQTVIGSVSRETARKIDLAALESDLAAIRAVLADHHAQMAEIEQRRIEQGEIEMLILGAI